MFEALSHTALQQYWWIIISILGSCLVFLLFVQGGQTLIYTLGKNEDERSLIVNSLGRKWEFTFTTLVTFGGAFFASFPLFYSTSFGGAYWVWMAILFCFVIQAVSYEFRSKPHNFLGQRTFEWFLFINGAVGTILLGTAIATFFTGSSFIVNFSNIAANENITISQWATPYHGLEAALNLHNLSLGLTVFLLARVLGILYFMNNINDENIYNRAKKNLIYNGIPFLVFFLAFTIALLLRKGFAVDPVSSEVYYENYKYLHNLLQMPLVGLLFIAGSGLVVYGMALPFINEPETKGIWYSGAGTILVVFCLFIIAGFNNTAYYPSVFDMQSSLTIYNSSSSKYTLTVMSYVSLLVPFVIAYIVIAWRAVNNKQISTEELNEESHNY